MQTLTLVLSGLGSGLLLALSAGTPLIQDTGSQEVVGPQDSLAKELEKAGILIDHKRGLCAIDAEVQERNDLLEYLLVAPHGAAHESLFLTPADPQVLNAALLTLGVEPGLNAVWNPKDPQPSEEELAAGANPYEVQLPEGGGFYLYAAWREKEELYLFRIEDLMRDLQRRRTMERHRWVFLGSRMTVRGSKGEEVFAASAEGNLINIAFFAQANTLITAALEACVYQTVWLPNAWLLPPHGSPVLFVFAKERIETLPPALLERVPEGLEERPDSRDKARRGR